MKALFCENCGGDEFIEQGGYRICRYCKSKFIPSKEERITKGVEISLNDDVNQLLQKCKSDPARAQRYAMLALEIDPGNREAQDILKGLR